MIVQSFWQIRGKEEVHIVGFVDFEGKSLFIKSQGNVGKYDELLPV
jgi:hypothetical protein